SSNGLGGFYFEAVPEVQLVRNRTVGRGFGAYVHSGCLKLRDFYGDIHLEPDAALIASGIINGDVTSYGNLSLTGTTALAISGDRPLQPSSTLSLVIRRDHAAGAIEVRGAATLDGTLTLRSVKGSKRVISRRKRWVVINAQTLSGAFANMFHDTSLALAKHIGDLLLVSTSNQIAVVKYHAPRQPVRSVDS